jgi:tetratricopeptide (TPR) repeat protein
MSDDCLKFDEFQTIGAGASLPRPRTEHLHSCKSCIHLLSELGYKLPGVSRRPSRFARESVIFACMGLVLPITAIVMKAYSRSLVGHQFERASLFAKAESIDRLRADPRAEEAVARAQAAGKAGEWKVSARFYSSALEQNPGNDVLRKAAAMAYMKFGEYEQAFAICKEAERRPKDLEYVANIAVKAKKDWGVRGMIETWDLPLLDSSTAAVAMYPLEWRIPWLVWGALIAILALVAPTLLNAYLFPTDSQQSDKTAASALGS